MERIAPVVGTVPFLEHYPEPGGPIQRVVLDHFPFRLGREPSAGLIIYSARVSKAHADIVRDGDDFYLQELGSSNGTFVNGVRLGQTGSVLLADGDIIQVANKELRFGVVRGVEAPPPDTLMTGASRPKLSHHPFENDAYLRALLAGGQVAALFQPVCLLEDGRTVGYEALGRGLHPQLPAAPGPLFQLAGQCQLIVPLSAAFRAAALADAARLPCAEYLFLNAHPEEMRRGNLPALLASLPPKDEGRRLVLEVHEDLVADLDALAFLRHEVHQRGHLLAYDDFGAGQARLAALVRVPADFVKLDRAIVAEVVHSRSMRDLALALARVCADLGTRLVAEGIETQDQVDFCRDIGCYLGQGYLFSQPQVPEAFAGG